MTYISYHQIIIYKPFHNFIYSPPQNQHSSFYQHYIMYQSSIIHQNFIQYKRLQNCFPYKMQPNQGIQLQPIQQTPIPNQSLVTQDHKQYDPNDSLDKSVVEAHDELTTQSSPKQVSVKQHHNKYYRPEIDGMRSVAIISVVIYHAWPKAIPGGFIGVDVFFVISGFLISQIIIKEISQDKFSFVNFYCRRIKRLYPVLILVLCLALWIIQFIVEDDLKIFSLNTVDASLVFASNIQILRHEKGYFDADIRNNPLLHLWSLGVEEQFYIVWPVLLIIIFKYFKKRALIILIAYTIFSFAFAIYGIFCQSTKFAFYFPICRFWQMSVGGIVGYLNLQIRNKMINEALSAVGLGVILIGCYVMNDESFFPGFWALLPTFGAAFIIQARQESSINKYVFSSQPCVWIGKISYSLYLWHWPLLVYSNAFYPKGSKSVFANTFFIIFLTVVASLMSYFTVEDRIRKMKGRKIVVVLLLLMGVIGLISIPMRSSDMTRIQFFKFVDKDMRPEEGDFVTINNKTQANLSFNKNRLKADDPMKINAAKMDQAFDGPYGGQRLLQKKVDEYSIYWDIPRPELSYYFVANQGRKNQLYIVGDSHAKKVTYRFQQLFWDSLKANTSDSLPTILAVIRQAKALVESSPLLNFTRELVKTYKPTRILFTCNWLIYFCKPLQDELSQPHRCDFEQGAKMIDEFVNYLVEIRSKGVEVVATKIEINNVQYSPFRMVDNNGVLQQNVQPFKHSDWKNKYKPAIQKFETALSKANIKMIELSDNLCWQDTCHVVSPKGYAAFVDRDHYGKFYARHWLTSVDELIKFDE